MYASAIKFKILNVYTNPTIILTEYFLEVMKLFYLFS